MVYINKTIVSLYVVIAQLISALGWKSNVLFGLIDNFSRRCIVVIDKHKMPEQNWWQLDLIAERFLLCILTLANNQILKLNGISTYWYRFMAAVCAFALCSCVNFDTYVYLAIILLK